MNYVHENDMNYVHEQKVYFIICRKLSYIAPISIFYFSFCFGLWHVRVILTSFVQLYYHHGNCIQQFLQTVSLLQCQNIQQSSNLALIFFFLCKMYQDHVTVKKKHQYYHPFMLTYLTKFQINCNRTTLYKKSGPQ